MDGLAAILGLIAFCAYALPAQAPASQQGQRKRSAEEIPYVLHVTTREVVIDLIAVDGHDRGVTDLASGELQVSETTDKTGEVPESISSLRLVDPNAVTSDDLPSGGFRIAANESCLQRRSIHYQLVYNPGSLALAPGNHEVHIKTSRRGVRLFYRHNYYVGATSPPETVVPLTKEKMDRDLWLNACSHALIPPSISLRAARISTGSTDTVRFRLNIDNDSLAFVTFSDNGRGLQLDYGACNFTAAGQPINFMSATSDQVLTPVEYARAEAHGLQKTFEFATPANLAMTRFVVRDRATGNIGLTDVVSTVSQMPHPGDLNQTPASTVAAEKALANQKNADFDHVSGYHSNGDDFLTASGHHDPAAEPLNGPVRSYGSVVPREPAFCGDVFELQPGIRILPDSSSCRTTAPDCRSMINPSSTSMACTRRRRAMA